jgi:ABC-type amino acid transport substrate-binding protein
MKAATRSLLIGLLGLLVFAPAASQASTVAQVKARGKLVMLCYPHPLSTFVKRGKTPGTFEGVDVSLMQTFAKSLGVPLEIKPVADFDDLIPALRRGEGDVIASSYSITRERAALVDYSEGYFPVLVMAVVRADSPIRRQEDLRGRKGATVPGSSQEERMRAVPAVVVHHVDSSPMNYEAVAKGEAEFAFMDSTSVLTNLSRFPNLKVAFHLPGAEYYGYAVTKGSDLRQVLSDHVKTLKRSGLLYDVIRRHLGEKGVEMFKLAQQAP